MNKKGQRTFNNENVHRIKMLRTLRGCWTSFIIAEKLFTARPLPKALPQVRQMSHFSEFEASKTFSDHVTRNASAAHNNEA